MPTEDRLPVTSPQPGPPIAVDHVAAANPADDAISAFAPRGSWLDWLLNALRHEPAHALTIVYLLVSALGVWAAYWFFGEFRIPILDYMDPTDYLTAGLRDPAYMLIVVGSLALTLLLNFHQYARVRGEDYYASIRARWWGRALLMGQPYARRRPDFLQRISGWRGFSMSTGLLFGVVWATMWLSFGYVRNKAQDIQRGGGHPVRVTFAHEHAPQPGTARLLGTVGDFVFLYWPAEQRAEAASVENIKRMQSLAPDAAAARKRAASPLPGRRAAPAAPGPAPAPQPAAH